MTHNADSVGRIMTVNGRKFDVQKRAGGYVYRRHNASGDWRSLHADTLTDARKALEAVAELDGFWDVTTSES